MRRIGIAWQIGTDFGWGLYGYHIAERLIARRIALPLPLEQPGTLDLDAHERMLLAPALADHDVVLGRLARETGASVPMRMPVLHARGNDATPAFSAAAARVKGRPNHALAFIESTLIGEDARSRLAEFDRVAAGSTWNKHLLEAAGLSNVVASLQGVDPTLFHPAPRSERYRDRFVIFSGGKLEYRKGQDIVTAAVGAFRQRHPETLLLAVWGNPWPDSPQGRLLAHSPHVDGAPVVDAQGNPEFGAWFARHSLPQEAVLAFNYMPHTKLARLMREADVALFPNRCEGGTNLAAMECMSAGVPTILSANTGHLDIIAEGACYPLCNQQPIALPTKRIGTDGWGESSVEEIIELLERVWRDRQAARAVGLKGAAHMDGFAWSRRIDGLIDLLGLAG
ncbi:MAG: glycosyltransferase family 4 protein [Alphaproteobacteria bacterium]|nr:glycosyltransferase family 4 protein [Alphaproteobacteria bacterium]